MIIIITNSRPVLVLTLELTAHMPLSPFFENISASE